MQVGLSLGPSFAELCAINLPGSKASKAAPSPIFTHRSYLPKENLKDLLRKLAEATPNCDFSQINVSLRALEKIFPTRLGGSVAQIVTTGFETWPWLRQPLSEAHFSMSTSRSEPLASQDLIFGLNERVNSQGQLLQNVDLEQLLEISERLKKSEISKVCLNFLFSQLNPTNEDRAKSFLQEQGFEVFCRTRVKKSLDEVIAWRTNILNACLSGTFLEMDRELKEALVLTFPGQEIAIKYVNSEAQLEANPLQNITGILFGWSAVAPNSEPILNLGLEKWHWILPDMSTRWHSPWGAVEIPHRNSQTLSIQPTSLLEQNFFHQVSWGDEQGFEPGPMSFGRSQKPLLTDLLFQHLPKARECFTTSIAASGESRFLDSLHLIQKTSGSSHLLEGLFEETLRLSLLCSTGPNIQLSGFWSEYLIDSYQKVFPKIQFHLTKNSSYIEAYHAAQIT
jgi:N-methylhydantoinase A